MKDLCVEIILENHISELKKLEKEIGLFGEEQFAAKSYMLLHSGS